MDPKHLLEVFGVVGLLGIIFAETGLLLGFFLPGDSLLVFAGLVAARPKVSTVHVNLAVVLVGCSVAAVVGAQTGYWIGRRAGPAIFRRPDSRFFKREYVEKAHSYFDRYGAKTIVVARFIPIVRTFANVVAGVGDMSSRAFATFNVVGGLLWVVSVTLLGYALGKNIPHAEDHLVVIEGVVIALSLVPVALEVRRSRRSASSRP